MLTIKKIRTSQNKPDIDIRVNGVRLAFSQKTYVMGILNVTPDSFSDGGEYFDKEDAVRRALRNSLQIQIASYTPAMTETDIIAAESYGYMNAILKSLGAR